MVMPNKEVPCNTIQAPARQVIDFIGNMATESLIAEVSTTPKPGLVDMISNGAHKDMNYNIFMDSAKAISPYFFKMAEQGYGWKASLPELFKVIRVIGMEAEKVMYQATGHVNTPKGLIFSAGILSTTAAYVYSKIGKFDTDMIFEICIQMTEAAIEKDFKNIDGKHPKTNGERLYIQYGNKGIRGEVQKGFPTVRNLSLPVLTDLMELNCSRNLSQIQVLMILMAFTEDTNVLARHNKETLHYVQETAKNFLSHGGIFANDGMYELRNMDTLFIEKNISSGGCADLLAVTIMLYKLSKGIKE
jgi:triphosphoribosyl-dephospho-CoA synthase